MGNTEEEVKTIIAKISKKELREITLDKRLFADLDIDSLRGAELLSRFSQKYNVFIPDEKLAEVSTVEDIIALLKNYLQNK